MGLFSPKKTTPRYRIQSTSGLNQYNVDNSDVNSNANKMGKVQHSPKQNAIIAIQKSASTADLVIPPFNKNQNSEKKIAVPANSNFNENNNGKLNASISLQSINSSSSNTSDQGQVDQKLVQTGLDRYITVQSKRKRSPRSAQYVSRNKATRVELETGEIPLGNRFSSLEIEGHDTVKVKNEKPPPIYLREASSNELVNLIATLTNSKFYIAPLKRGNIHETKIQPFEIEGYRTLVKQFDESGKKYYTYQLKSQKGLTVVIKGIESCVAVSDIQAALAAEGFHVKSIGNIVNREKVPQPMFRVELEPDEIKLKGRHNIYNLKYLLHRKVTIEEPKKRSGPVQCVKCQEYGHTKAYCTLTDVCVICGELHDSKQCNKSKNDPTAKRCSNCGENHTANYRGCLVYLDLKRKINPRLRAEQRMLKSQYNQREMIPRNSTVKPTSANTQNHNLETSANSFAQPGISYANIVEGNVNITEKELNIHTMLNKLTETIQSFMMMMERQMSMMMQNMNTLMQIIVKNQK